MQRELVIAAGPGEWRAALLEAGVPVELFVERGDRAEIGSIHLGRVVRVVSGLDAAIVDIAEERPGFLPQSAIVPRGKRLHEGERVLVQIRREAQDGKAARLTMAVSLRGRHVDMILGRPGLEGSELLPQHERDELLAALGTFIRPRIPVRGGSGENVTGLRIREAEPLTKLVAEMARLVERRQEILDHTARLDPPARIDPVGSFAAALAAAVPGAPGRIIVDEPGAVPEIRAAFAAAIVQHLPDTEWPADLDGSFAEALSDMVALPGGGSAHFEATRAGALIDVDSGTPETGSAERIGLATNLAAAAAIARQLRLRNLGGGIVIDFVGLDARLSREKVRARLATMLLTDPAGPQILGWTRLGHLEVVRPRRRRPLAEALLEQRPGGARIKTAITVAHEALRTLRREARALPGRQWRLTVAPDVAAALTGSAASAVQQAEQRFARHIAVSIDRGRQRERFQIAPL
ncbi:MAG: ribonuclease E/G [Alphaproteobacteria bacterium]|nr:ribonuclease E/G [Alphaproteobacteria bacterium]